MAYRVVEKQVIFDSKRARLEIHHLEDQDTGKRTRREIVVHPGAVVVLAFRGDNEILLIRNRRYAVDQTLLELPAGTLEKGEDPMNCAGRELLEETGHLAGRLVPMGSFYTSPGILSEKMYAFAAYDLEAQETSLDEGEEIELAPVAFDEAIELIRTGDIRDGKTIATILMYDRFRRSG